MRRALLLLLLGAGCGLRVVPEAQAAADLQCSHVHVSVGWKTQIATGCGRSVTYREVCAEDGKSCRFERVRSWAEGYDLANAMP
jgi:hypothetical protein